MSDEEEEMQEEEAEAEEAPKPEEEEAPAPAPAPAEEEEEAPVKQEEEKVKPKPPPPRPKPADDDEGGKEMTEAEKALMAQRKKHEEEEALKLKDYEEQRRIEKVKEEDELRQLKEKQERRRLEREEEDRIMAERKQQEEERRKADEDARKAKIEADKAKKEEEKKKKAAMMAGLQHTGPALTIQKKEKAQVDQYGNIVKEKKAPKETKEQHDANKKDHLKKIVGELQTSNDIDTLRKQVKAMHQRILKLEASRYDLEKRGERQEYDLKELNDRQRQQSRNKALAKGMDPDEATSSVHPPKLPTASKYDRQIDRRSYGDRRVLFSSDKRSKQKALFHGSARPPNEWGRHESEELEQLRKNMEPPKYVEAVKVEGAKPPMNAIPVSIPAADAEEPMPAEPAAAAT
jgi:troponin T